MQNVEPKRNVGQAGKVAKDRAAGRWGGSGKQVGAVLRGLPPVLAADIATTLVQYAAGIGLERPGDLAEIVGDDLSRIAEDRPEFFHRLLVMIGQAIAEEYSLRPAWAIVKLIPKKPGKPARLAGQAPARPDGE